MSVLEAPTAVLVAPTAPTTPALADVVRRVAANLLVACGVPAVLLYTMLQVAGLVPAVLTALVWAYGAMAWRHATGRPTSGLLLLMTVVLTARTLFTVATGDSTVYFLEPIVTDAVVACLFLASLATARPLVARMATDFYPVSAELAAAPRVRRLFRRLTVMWAGVGILKAGVGLWMLESLSTADFVLVKTSTIITLTVLAVVVTFRASVLTLRTVPAPA